MKSDLNVFFVQVVLVDARVRNYELCSIIIEQQQQKLTINAFMEMYQKKVCFLFNGNFDKCIKTSAF